MTRQVPLLSIRSLRVTFQTREGPAHAVRDVSFDVGAGETLALVGESGSGKSVTALAVMRLIDNPPGRISGGRILLDGMDLLGLSETEMRRLRGNAISMIFQEPMTSLNPVMTVGRQVAEAVRLHRGGGRAAARKRALQALELVQIPEAARRLDQYPHELSGGMRQRVMIAMALACEPRVLIADEPTTALDVTVQAEVLELLRDLRQRLGTAIMLITHDLGVVAALADRVAVCYAGSIVETGPVRDVLRTPRHPYTLGLLGAMPRLTHDGAPPDGARLLEIPGTVPAPGEMPRGCAFAPRCRHAVEQCRGEAPTLRMHSAAHHAACWRSDEIAGNA